MSSDQIDKIMHTICGFAGAVEKVDPGSRFLVFGISSDGNFFSATTGGDSPVGFADIARDAERILLNGARNA